MADSVSTVEATASAITHKNLTAKSTGRSFVLYTVETDMGSFTTAKRELAEQAHRLLNKPARYEVKTEQRGDFTNYYLESVEAVNGEQGGGFQSPLGPRGGTSFETPAPTPQKPAQEPQQPIGDPAGPTDKDTFIFRQTAAKVAATLSRTPGEFWENVVYLTQYFSDGTVPPEFVSPDVSGDDDIPF